MRLPAPVYNIKKSRSDITQMRGINFSDAINDGDIADSRNISARRFPYIATRRKRTKQSFYSGASALTSWEGLVAVEGTDLLYNGRIVGSVSAGEKQFAVVNTKLVIFPDKVYLDLQSQVVRTLGASFSCTGGTFTTDTLTVTGDLTSYFKVGDCVKIAGSSVDANNKNVVITALTETVITVS